MYHEYLYPNMIVFSTLSARSGAEVNIIRRIMADRERDGVVLGHVTGRRNHHSITDNMARY